MKNWLAFLLLFSFHCYGQGQLVIDKNTSILGVSVTDRLSYFEDEGRVLSPQEFLENKSILKEVKMTSPFESLDFSMSSFFIHFTLKNESEKDQYLVLETGLPYTDKVTLYCVDTKETMYTGDAVPFDKKCLPTNTCALAVFVPSGERREYVLQFISEGEKMSIPMIFSDRKEYMEAHSNRKMFIGIFLGILIFVSIIYIAFFVMLKERLFLIYVLYAIFSGFLQFSLDGYIHEFVFHSGGYFAQHSIIIASAGTVVFGLMYTMKYLALTGIRKKTLGLTVAMVLLTLILSLIPEIPFEIIYNLIMSFTLIGIVFMIVNGFIERKKISILFLIGLTFLVLGTFVFILGDIGVITFPLITQNALKTGTLLEMICLSILMAGRYKELQQEREIAQHRLLLELEEKNRIASETNERLEFDVKERTRKIEAQRLELKGQNEDFMSSVIYAKRIQRAVLSNEEQFKKRLPNSFVLIKPKDIVSGDFYWVDVLDSPTELTSNFMSYVTADCTGHGVPGALVSIIGNHVLEEVKFSNGLMNPGQALDEISKGMNTALNSRYATQNLSDGMDLTLCVLDQKEHKLYFSGARNSAYIVRKGELIELKGDRKSIGFNPKEETHEFQTQIMQLEIGDIIYTCSDGYADQFGGPKGKKFMSKQLKSLFVEISSLPLEAQKVKLKETLMEWMGDNEQLDDILVIGVEIV